MPPLLRPTVVLALLAFSCGVDAGHDAPRMSRTSAAVHPPVAVSDSGRIVAPVAIKRVQPVFSAGSWTSAPVIVAEATVTKAGDVRDVKIVKGSNEMCNRAVADALRQWKFRPGIVDGRPVDMTYYVTVRIHVR